MKFLARKEKDEWRFNRLKRGSNVMVSIYNSLYPVCNDVLVKDVKSEDCIAFYPSGDTQPLMPKPYHVDTDFMIV